jgi:hypothetical protein
MTTPLHLQTRGNRRQWIADRLWARKLSLRYRLMLGRQEAKREFLPVRPVWRRGSIPQLHDTARRFSPER